MFRDSFAFRVAVVDRGPALLLGPVKDSGVRRRRSARSFSSVWSCRMFRDSFAFRAENEIRLNFAPASTGALLPSWRQNIPYPAPGPRPAPDTGHRLRGGGEARAGFCPRHNIASVEGSMRINSGKSAHLSGCFLVSVERLLRRPVQCGFQPGSQRRRHRNQRHLGQIVLLEERSP